MCRTKEIADYRWKEMQQEDFASYTKKTDAVPADTQDAQLDLSGRKQLDFNSAN